MAEGKGGKARTFFSPYPQAQGAMAGSCRTSPTHADPVLRTPTSVRGAAAGEAGLGWWGGGEELMRECVEGVEICRLAQTRS